MKKSMVALATMSMASGVFAQVTITGTLAYGFKASTSTGTSAMTVFGAPVSAPTSGNKSSGWGVDTSQINIGVKEDLGGGQVIEATMAFAGADRSGESTYAGVGNGAVTGRDATLTYTNTSIGQFKFGTTEGSAVHSGIPSADAPVIDFDGKLFELKSSSDFVSYAVPIGPVFFQYKLSEATAGMGLGSGTEGAAGVSVKQRTSDFAVAYLKGPLSVVGAYRSYDNRNKDTIATAEGLTKDQVYAFQLGYDAGFAKFGLGYNVITASVGPRVQDALIGVSVPAGQWTFGATFASAATSGVNDTALTAFPSAPVPAAVFKENMMRADGTATGYSLGARYAMSKRTSLTLKYASWVRSGYEQFEAFNSSHNLGEFGYTDRATETSLLLSHSF